MIIAQNVNILDGDYPETIETITSTEESQLVTAELTAKIRADWNLIGMYADHHSTTMRKHYEYAIAFTDSIFIGRARTEWMASSYLHTFAFRLYRALRDVCFDYDNHMHHVHSVHDDYIADCMPTEQVAE